MGQGLRTIVDSFESKWGFPQCTGAIDGSHIPIIAPAENALDYYNRKGFHSVILQAVVDHEYKFLMYVWAGPAVCMMLECLATPSFMQNVKAGVFYQTGPRPSAIAQSHS